MARSVSYLFPSLAPTPPAPAGTGSLSAIPEAGAHSVLLRLATNGSGLAGVTPVNPGLARGSDSQGFLRGVGARSGGGSPWMGGLPSSLAVRGPAASVPGKDILAPRSSAERRLWPRQAA